LVIFRDARHRLFFAFNVGDQLPKPSVHLFGILGIAQRLFQYANLQFQVDNLAFGFYESFLQGFVPGFIDVEATGGLCVGIAIVWIELRLPDVKKLELPEH
jgi:hypothetical protein